MRIGIDCRLAGQAHAGIGRYIENLVRRLPTIDPETEWVYFFHDQKQATEVLSGLEMPASVAIKIVPIRHYSFAEQTNLSQIFVSEHLDLLHVPHFNVPLAYTGALVVTIHDLLWHEYHGPKVTTLKPWQYWFKYAAYRVVARTAISRAKKILVPAETIKQTLTRYYPWTNQKIVVTKEGVFVPSTQIKHGQKLDRTKNQKYLLYVGSLYPHKNVELVAKALSELPDYKLLIVGSRNVFQATFIAKIKELKLLKQVEFLGYKTDSELSELYTLVDAVVQPSLSEGFGLTGVEAMAAGTPVLASQIPIFEEVYQDAAVLFDPLSTSSFIQAVHQLENMDIETLRKKGRRVASSYSWDEMAHQTLQAYHSALNS